MYVLEGVKVLLERTCSRGRDLLQDSQDTVVPLVDSRVNSYLRGIMLICVYVLVIRIDYKSLAYLNNRDYATL